MFFNYITIAFNNLVTIFAVFNQTKNINQLKKTKVMKIKELAEKITKIAETNKGGFTLNINTLTLINSGYVASYKATQNSFSETDLQSVINHALSHGGVVGGWYNKKDKKYYFDSNKIFNNIAKAIKFGVENQQLAIFDIDNLHEIRL